MKTHDLLKNINHEDQKVTQIVNKEIPKIEQLVKVITSKLQFNGRLFILGPVQVLTWYFSASECPPHFEFPQIKWWINCWW